MRQRANSLVSGGKLVVGGMLATVLVSCSMVGGSSVPKDAAKAAALTCEQWGQWETAQKQELAEVLLEAEGGQLTPEQIDLYVDGIENKCYITLPETAVGYLHDWKVPYGSAEQAIDYGSLGEAQALALMPTAADWSAIDRELSVEEAPLVVTNEPLPESADYSVSGRDICYAMPQQVLWTSGAFAGERHVDSTAVSRDAEGKQTQGQNLTVYLTSGPQGQELVQTYEQYVTDWQECGLTEMMQWVVPLDAGSSGIPGAFQVAESYSVYMKEWGSVTTVAPTGSGYFQHEHFFLIDPASQGSLEKIVEYSTKMAEANRENVQRLYETVRAGGAQK